MYVNERGIINIFDMQNTLKAIDKKNTEYRYFFAYKDAYSNFTFLKSLLNNDVNEVAKKLTNIFAIIGAPKILESENGQNYCEKLVKAISSDIPNLKIISNEERIKKLNSKNEMTRDYKSLIEYWKNCNPKKPWHEGLKFIQIMENTKLISTGEIKKSPAELMLGKNVYQGLMKLIKNKDVISKSKNDYSDTQNGWINEVNDKEIPEQDKQKKNCTFNQDITNSRSTCSLQCNYCKTKFNFPSILERHMRTHTNERPYACNICNKSFKQLGHLSQHSITHTDNHSIETINGNNNKVNNNEESTKIKLCRPKFECEICKKVFTTKSVLERHVSIHSDERKYSCNICGKRFKQAGHVKSHMLVHTGEKKFQCQICLKSFSLSNSLKKHMYIHNGEKPYQCDKCGSRFLEKRNLNGHLMTHTNKKPFFCKICGKRYTLADTLRRHISSAHKDGRTFQCEICAKMFKQLAHLSVHKKVHNDERPYQCHLCDKNFKHKNVLQSHLAIHANIRPFQCDTCKATFVRKTNLQTHIISAHMNERPYACKICNKRFKQISHLNGHIIVHSNSMPYQCDHCERRCNRLDNLKKHMKLHTKTNKFP